MDAFHFSTHAIEGLRNFGAEDFSTLKNTLRNIQHVSALLNSAVKFQLPDNGQLIQGELRALPEVFRLPYPVIAVEFRVTQTSLLGQQPIKAMGESVSVSSKRVALAIEINEATFDAFNWLLPDSKYELFVADGSVAVVPVFYSDQADQWSLPPCAVVIPGRKSEVAQDKATATKQVFGGQLPQGTKLLPIEMHPVPLLPEYCAWLEARENENYTNAVAMQDCLDEVPAVLNLIEVLACRNVTSETQAPSTALNKKRILNGKTPFYEYKILTLDGSSVATSKPRATGALSASPRVHLRRGHIRRLPDRVVWVNAAVVGNRNSGMLVKDYSVLAQRGSPD